MPFYLDAIVIPDTTTRRYRVAVIYDPDDPSSIVCDADAGGMPTGHQYDPDKCYLSTEQIDGTIRAMGFRVVGGKPETRTVVRDSQHGFYDPATREWYTCDPTDRRESQR